MVRIIDFKQRQNAEGESFFTLQLEGDIEMIQSQITGNFYATARRCSITSTFTEETCKALVGTALPGSIEKVQVEEPYEYVVKETNEAIMLDYTYRYNPNESASMEEAVFGVKPTNGRAKVKELELEEELAD